MVGNSGLNPASNGVGFSYLFFSWGVVGIKNGVYLWGQTKTHTMKNEILKAIGSRLMEDARVYMDSPERPFNPTNDNQPSSFIAVCDAMEDIDKLLGWA